MTKRLVKCPICLRQSLVTHCDTERCGWWMCRNKDCDAVLDLSKKRGHAVDFADRTKRRRVVLR